ncbi:monocarboxylate transporter 6 isoform X2 [Patella vulgata]|uniref:monocarboxylate transporter 6 isoform X2 n=1 Tax=Patella vulgata TaxID=6465 RepID=UPI0021807D7B|nr:monocarboxylate transporter 6 isoform X2 [Patella vulgata]XP_050419227.1 monocarboxylate transporter 6 isoform X2 [Patella vulgata]XP_055959169.1 monocarboxylate transporter 6 isoform X2 [Patella vulgata]
MAQKEYDMQQSVGKVEEEILVVDSNNKKGCLGKFRARSASEWILLMGCCVCHGLMIGYTYGMGSLFLEIKDSFGASRAETAMVQSITIGLMCCGGLLSPLLVSIIGNGNTMLIGTTIACSAIIGGGLLVESISLLIIIVGAIGGLGLCNIFIGMFVSVGKIFKEDYRVALAALILSAGVGNFIFPYMNVLILEQYNWRGVFLINGGLLLHTIPLALFIRIILPKEKPDQTESKKCFSNSYFRSHVSLWKDRLHVTYFICLIIRSVPLALINYFMLDIAVYKNFDEIDGSLFLSAVGFGNMFGRVAVLISRNIINISPVIEYALHITFTGLTVFLLGLSNSYGLIIASCTIFGLGFGLLTSTVNIAVFAIAGEDRYPTALGITNTGVGIGFGIAGPIGGVIKDNVESYDHILFVFAAICTLSGIWLLVVAIFSIGKNKQKTAK